MSNIVYISEWILEVIDIITQKYSLSFWLSQEARNKAEIKEKELEMKKRQEIDDRIENEKRAAILEVIWIIMFNLDDL